MIYILPHRITTPTAQAFLDWCDAHNIKFKGLQPHYYVQQYSLSEGRFCRPALGPDCSNRWFAPAEQGRTSLRQGVKDYENHGGERGDGICNADSVHHGHVGRRRLQMIFRVLLFITLI